MLSETKKKRQLPLLYKLFQMIKIRGENQFFIFRLTIVPENLTSSFLNCRKSRLHRMKLCLKVFPIIDRKKYTFLFSSCVNQILNGHYCSFRKDTQLIF